MDRSSSDEALSTWCGVNKAAASPLVVCGAIFSVGGGDVSWGVCGGGVGVRTAQATGA